MTAAALTTFDVIDKVSCVISRIPVNLSMQDVAGLVAPPQPNESGETCLTNTQETGIGRVMADLYAFVPNGRIVATKLKMFRENELPNKFGVVEYTLALGRAASDAPLGDQNELKQKKSILLKSLYRFMLLQQRTDKLEIENKPSQPDEAAKAFIFHFVLIHNDKQSLFLEPAPSIDRFVTLTRIAEHTMDKNFFTQTASTPFVSGAGITALTEAPNEARRKFDSEMMHMYLLAKIEIEQIADKVLLRFPLFLRSEAHREQTENICLLSVSELEWLNLFFQEKSLSETISSLKAMGDRYIAMSNDHRKTIETFFQQQLSSLVNQNEHFLIQ